MAPILMRLKLKFRMFEKYILCYRCSFSLKIEIRLYSNCINCYQEAIRGNNLGSEISIVLDDCQFHLSLDINFRKKRNDVRERSKSKFDKRDLFIGFIYIPG